MTRTLATIAQEIRDDWKKPYFGAEPYLRALAEMDHVPAARESVRHNNYGLDTADMVILYFLSNAQTWKGETARRIKAELKELAR